MFKILGQWWRRQLGEPVKEVSVGDEFTWWFKTFILDETAVEEMNNWGFKRDKDKAWPLKNFTVSVLKKSGGRKDIHPKKIAQLMKL